MMANKKLRVDLLLVQRGLVESRTLAQRLVMAGQVLLEGEVVLKPSDTCLADARLEIIKQPDYVSRGGIKLKEALDKFAITVNGLVCTDVGASTGGFTDCLLQQGASKVYAIDVGFGILHWKLRNHPQVVVMERTNARYVTDLPERIALATIDASFISLNVLLPVVKTWFLDQAGEVVALIKPQFEAGRQQVKAGAGVVRDHDVHAAVLNKVLNEAAGFGFFVAGLTASPIKGPKGNVEFLLHLRCNTDELNDLDFATKIETAMAAMPE